ncbi:MAG: ACP S-malonyltransferase [Planctomycetia bacterium]|nr:ACP S-malonyltransferase [Planctomycetia bacterium]
MEKIAFLFPGQGAQFVGMGRGLYDTLPAVKELFDEADALLGFSLSKICFEGPEEELNSTVVSQPAIFVTSLAALECLKESRPEVVANCGAAAGLSLGEYTALTFAGVMEFADALRVVQKRGQAMQAAADVTAGGMVSLLGLDESGVREMCEKVRGADILELANLLCPGNNVVSGTKTACERLVEEAENSGSARAVPLAVAGAFHTEIMKPADQVLEEALREVSFRTPRIPVVSNVDAKAHMDPDEIRKVLVRQVLSPVMWEDSVRNLMSEGYNCFYEIGPGRVLRGLLKRIDRKMPVQNVEV